VRTNGKVIGGLPLPTRLPQDLSIPQIMSQESDRLLHERYVRNQDSLYGYIMSILPNGMDADDVFQETSLVLWEKRDSYDPDRSFLAWSYGIARNVARNSIRKKQNRGQTLTPELFDAVAEARLRAADTLQQRSEALKHCLEKLPGRQRSFVMDCYERKTPLAALAERMGLSGNALYLRLSRIRRSLLNCVQRTLHAEGEA
jgi:RNA polymerase sigma-70 factor (ECF subfamily)